MIAEYFNNHDFEDLENKTQIEALKSLEKGISEAYDSGNMRTRTFSITADRGWGKTTLLHRLRASLKESTYFTPTRIIDASTISEEVGIMGACIQALKEAVFPNATPQNAQPPQPPKEFQATFDKAFENALNQQTSYRKLAQEMAMSPEHFNHMVRDWAKGQNCVTEDFDKFIASLAKGDNPTHVATPALVVIIDDLDLAEAGLVKTWVRAMVNIYRDTKARPVYWVFSFERERLIGAISSPRTLDDGTYVPDLTTGRALLTKLVSFHRQFELDYWKVIFVEVHNCTMERAMVVWYIDWTAR